MGDSARLRLYRALAWRDSGTLGRRATSSFLVVTIAIAVCSVIFGTLPNLPQIWQRVLAGGRYFSLIVFTLEYLARIWVTPEASPLGQDHPWRGRWRYMISFIGLVDLLTVLPRYAAFATPVNQDVLYVIQLLAILKLIRYSRALVLVATVFRNEARALMASLMVMGVLMILVSGVMYGIERHAQPKAFGSIPSAMWWSIITMTTVGYGDVIPITPIGRVFGGFVMVLGIIMFALPAGILATGFAAEIRRRDFVVTWRTVAGVPLFARLDATQIAEIARLLRTQVVPAHQVVVRRGGPADAMFFIMSGEVEVDVSPEPVRLGKGQYFGEIALLRDTRRSATVVTLSECQLLILASSDFRSLMQRHPDLRAAVVREAELRMKGPHYASPSEDNI